MYVTHEGSHRPATISTTTLLRVDPAPSRGPDGPGPPDHAVAGRVEWMASPERAEAGRGGEVAVSAAEADVRRGRQQGPDIRDPIERRDEKAYGALSRAAAGTGGRRNARPLFSGRTASGNAHTLPPYACMSFGITQLCRNSKRVRSRIGKSRKKFSESIFSARQPGRIATSTSEFPSRLPSGQPVSGRRGSMGWCSLSPEWPASPPGLTTAAVPPRRYSRWRRRRLLATLKADSARPRRGARCPTEVWSPPWRRWSS